MSRDYFSPPVEMSLMFISVFVVSGWIVGLLTILGYALLFSIIQWIDNRRVKGVARQMAEDKSQPSGRIDCASSEQLTQDRGAIPPWVHQSPQKCAQKVASAHAIPAALPVENAKDQSLAPHVRRYSAAFFKALAKGHLTAYDLAELRVTQLTLSVTDAEREAFEIDLLGETAESREQKDTLRVEVEKREQESRLKQAEERRLAALREIEETDRKTQQTREKEQQDRLRREAATLGAQRKEIFLDAVRAATSQGSIAEGELSRLRRYQIDLGITDAERFRWETELLRESTVTWGR